MSFEKVKTLGRYNFRAGGSISISMGPNMEFGTEVSTTIHEMYHMHLINMTNIGFALNVLEMERVLAVGVDNLQYERMERYTDIISQRIIHVQEIYANSMEMLIISEMGGKESAKICYEIKPEYYKYYCDYLKVITRNNELSFSEKQTLINTLCMYAMNIKIDSEEFISSLQSDKKLSKYFSGENHPDQRLSKGIELYKKGQVIEINKSLEQLCISEFLNNIQVNGIIKYVNQYFKEWKQEYEKIIRDIDSVDHIQKVYEKNIEERIKLFDLSTIKVVRMPLNMWKTKCCFPIKNCANLDNQNDNFYIIGYEIFNDEPIYAGEEVTPLQFFELVKDKACILVHFNEYDLVNCRPKYFEIPEKPIIVLIDDYKECFYWIQDELTKGELYIGDLYEEIVGNYYTVLFFAKRNDSNTIFVFPTLKKLAKGLIMTLNLKDEVFYSNQVEFLKIISCLENENAMLLVIQWLLSFFTNSKGRFSPEDDPAAKLSFDLTRTLLNSALPIKMNNHYKYQADLPTKKTIGKPFYTLMKFDKGTNTGIIKAETNESFPLFFNSRREADYWKYKNAFELQTYQVVGIDLRYWETLKELLGKANKKVCICIDVLLNRALVVELAKIDDFIANL